MGEKQSGCAKLAVFALLVALAPQLDAANIVWEGDLGTDFETAGNWQGGAIPKNNDYSDYAVFRDSSPLPSNRTPTMTVNRSVCGITFNDSVGWTLSGTGRQLLLKNVTSTGAGINTVLPKLKTAPYDFTWTIGEGNTLDLAGGLYQDGGGKSLTIVGGGTVVLGSRIDGWSGTLKLNVADAIVKINGTTPFANGGSVYLTSAESALFLKTTTQAATSLIGTKIIDGVGSGLTVTDAGDGYAQVSVPEPAAISLLAIGSLMTLRRRR